MAVIIKRSNGNYCVRVSDGRKNGKQVVMNATYRPPEGASKAAIEKGLKEFAGAFEALVHSGAVRAGQKKKITEYFGMTVGEYVEKFYLQEISQTLSPNTVRFYCSVLDEFILPSFGSVRLVDITSEHLQAFVDCLSSEGARKDGSDMRPMSPGSVKRYSTVLRSVITTAWKRGFITENKIKSGFVSYPKSCKEELKPYTATEAEEFVAALKKESPQTRLLLLVALMLGLRRAEIVALKWSDVDWEMHAIHINKSAYKPKGGVQKLKATKSVSSNRTVYYGEEVEEALLSWQATQQAYKKERKITWREQDYVFTTDTGDMISVYAPTRICSRFEEKYGLRHLKLHGLRHTCGSLMIKNGVDRVTVSKWLGHESTDVTEIYVHSYEDSLVAASQALDRAVRKENLGENTKYTGGSS